MASKSDLILAFGGDGTLLHIAEEAALHKKPVIGFNLGNLGFLTEGPLSNFQTILDNYFKNNLRSDLRNLINQMFTDKPKLGIAAFGTGVRGKSKNVR